MMRGLRRTNMNHWIPVLGAVFILFLATTEVRGQSGAHLDTSQNRSVASEQGLGVPVLDKDQEKPELKDEVPKQIQTDPTSLSPSLTTPPGKAPEPETENADDGALAASGSEQSLTKNDEAKAVPDLLAGNDDAKAVVGSDTKGVTGENTTVAITTPETAAPVAAKPAASDGESPLPAAVNGDEAVSPNPEVNAGPQVMDLSTKNGTQMSSEKNASKEKIVDVSDDKAVVTEVNTEEATEAPVPGGAAGAAGEGTTAAPPVDKPKSPPTDPPIKPEPTTTTSTTTTTTVATTTPPPVTTPIVVVPSVIVPGKTDPPYVHITELSTSATSTQNGTLVGKPAGSSSFSPKVIAIIVGAALGLIAVIVIITVVVIVIKRKKRRDRRDIPIIENPRYISANTQQAHNYRFSRDASLMIGGPHHLANNNHNEKNDMNSIRKKRRAPPAPNPFTGEVEGFPLNHDGVQYYEKFPTSKRKAPPPPVPSFTGGNGSLSNPYCLEYYEQLSRNKGRRAPPPPNPFTGEVDAFLNPNSVSYIDEDTPHGSEVELTTFGAKSQPEVHYAVPDDPAPSSTAATAGTLTDEEIATQNDFSDTDDDDVNRSAEELEGRALLEDIEHETGYRIRPNSSSNRKSLADKYQFSDDEEARDSRDYHRARDVESVGDSEDELDGAEAMSYDVSDITDVTDSPAPAPPSPAPPKPPRAHSSAYDPSKNPFES